MSYAINQDGTITRSDGCIIHPDKSNIDYLNYLDWVAAGNTATPYEPSLAEAQSKQIEINSAACSDAITSGFQSSALGSAHTYPSKVTDQQNLTASVVASLVPGNPSNWSTPFWCQDENGAWSYVNHSEAQIQQVGQDGKAAILVALSKNATLQAQVMAATSVSAVQAITW